MGWTERAWQPVMRFQPRLSDIYGVDWPAPLRKCTLELLELATHPHPPAITTIYHTFPLVIPCTITYNAEALTGGAPPSLCRWNTFPVISESDTVSLFNWRSKTCLFTPPTLQPTLTIHCSLSFASFSCRLAFHCPLRPHSCVGTRKHILAVFLEMFVLSCDHYPCLNLLSFSLITFHSPFHLITKHLKGEKNDWKKSEKCIFFGVVQCVVRQLQTLMKCPRDGRCYVMAIVQSMVVSILTSNIGTVTAQTTSAQEFKRTQKKDYFMTLALFLFVSHLTALTIFFLGVKKGFTHTAFTASCFICFIVLLLVLFSVCMSVSVNFT